LFAGFLVVAVGAAWFVMSASVDPVVTDESNVSTISKENIAQQPLETPSIAVLPFVNMSGDPEQEYFSDGISEDIITDLSRLKNVAVIARNSTFSYKGTVTTTKDIANALNVSHVLEGSVRRSDDRVRITAQLIDVSNGQHIWADRYDRELHDVFAVQDEITKQIVAALTLRLHDGENETIVHPTATNNFEAYDLFLKGLSMYYNYSDESLQNSVELFREAINLDPEFSRAYASLAVSLMRQAFAGHTSHPVETRKRSYELAHKAVSLDPNSPHALWALGFVYMHRRQFEDSIAALEKAISIRPQYAEAYSLLALVNNNLGNADEAIRLIETGMEINPNYTWDYLFNLGRAYYIQGDYKNAVKYLERAIERNPNVAPLRVFLAASYVNLDRIGDAEWQIVELEMQHPNSSLSHWENTYPIASKERINKLLNDLRSAGMKE
jgi:adenylate cyclase